MAKRIVVTLGLLVCINVQADNNITSLSDNGIKNWEPKIFDRESVYTVKHYQGQVSLYAQSQSATSGLLLKQSIDLIATPHLSWS